MRILLVDDHVLFRESLSSLLDEQPDFNVVGQTGTVREAITMAKTLEPDLVLMDFGLPDGTGLAAMQAILAEKPETKIVFLTVYEADEQLFEAVRSGAKGYLLKNVTVFKLLDYLRGVKQGEAAVSQAMVSRILSEFSRQRSTLDPDFQPPPRKLDALTAREIEVLHVLATGTSNQEIAEALFISENTVKNHIHSILTKLHLRNRREAVRYAQRHGLGDSSFIHPSESK